MKKVILTQIDLYEKAKDGTLLTFIDKKTGEKKRYKKARIGIQGMKDKAWGAVWSSQSPINNWEPDMEVEIDLYQDEKGYWNFKLPNKESAVPDRITALEKDVAEIKKLLLSEPKNEKEEPIGELGDSELGDLENDIKAEDLPF